MTYDSFTSAEAAWDSESRLSPFCTVYSPVQDDDDLWQDYYNAALDAGMTPAQATEHADAEMS